MIFKPVQECYVYITLPGQTEPVTAGRFVSTVDRNGVPLGRFVYGKHYLERPNAVPFDPIELKLGTGVYETKGLKGIFGVLRDAGPDYWGRRVIERHVNKQQLSELDYLLCAPDDHVGALAFGLNQVPPAPKKMFNQTLDLEKLQRIADAILREEDLPTAAIPKAFQELGRSLSGERAERTLKVREHANPEKRRPQLLKGEGYINTQVQDLMLIGTSMGGARPKVVIEDEDGLWIAKFNCPDDKWNQARVERSMLVLARQCGLSVADSKVKVIGNKDVLLVKRFDRERTKNGYLRARMMSALTLLRAEDTYQSREKWSYILFVEALRRVSAEPKKDTVELFLRMCFNALVSNTDDHPRNHAIIAKDQHWRLSPAYDLTPSVPISLERRDLAMVCGDQGRFANADNLLSQHARFLLNKEEALGAIHTMETYIKNNWYKAVRSEGVSERDCEKIAPAFVYPGFEGTG